MIWNIKNYEEICKFDEFIADMARQLKFCFNGYRKGEAIHMIDTFEKTYGLVY